MIHMPHRCIISPVYRRHHMSSQRHRPALLAALLTAVLSLTDRMGGSVLAMATSPPAACPKTTAGANNGAKLVKCKYLIVGGGAAGLTAAYNLKHHGKVSGRADGRMKSPPPPRTSAPPPSSSTSSSTGHSGAHLSQPANQPWNPSSAQHASTWTVWRTAAPIGDLTRSPTLCAPSKIVL